MKSFTGSGVCFPLVKPNGIEFEFGRRRGGGDAAERMRYPSYSLVSYCKRIFSFSIACFTSSAPLRKRRIFCNNSIRSERSATARRTKREELTDVHADPRQIMSAEQFDHLRFAEFRKKSEKEMNRHLKFVLEKRLARSAGQPVVPTHRFNVMPKTLLNNRIEIQRMILHRRYITFVDGKEFI